MSAESFLSSIIEISIAIAGFAGIVAAIRNQDVTRWAENDQILLRMLLAASGAPICFALLPTILKEAGLPGPMVWRTGSILLLLFLFAILMRRIGQFREADSIPDFPRGLQFGLIGSVLLQTLNIYLGTSWPYLIGIFLIVLNGFTFFLLLLFGSASERIEDL